jgi:hypothetical protein
LYITTSIIRNTPECIRILITRKAQPLARASQCCSVSRPCSISSSGLGTHHWEVVVVPIGSVPISRACGIACRIAVPNDGEVRAVAQGGCKAQRRECGRDSKGVSRARRLHRTAKAMGIVAPAKTHPSPDLVGRSTVARRTLPPCELLISLQCPLDYSCQRISPKRIEVGQSGPEEGIGGGVETPRPPAGRLVCGLPCRISATVIWGDLVPGRRVPPGERWR